METYIAVVTLMQDLEHLLNTSKDIIGLDHVLFPFTRKEIEILYQTVNSMDSFLRDSSGESYNHEIINPVLEKRIRYVVYEAANYVDFWVALCLPDPDPDLAVQAPSSGKITSSQRQIADEGAIERLARHAMDWMKMRSCLTKHPSKLEVYSIVGPAGIGKTIFARRLYESREVMHHFDVCAWVTISQNYQLREILMSILCCVTNSLHEIYPRSDKELRKKVYKSLKGKRYLIVLDDIRDIKALDDLKRAFPDNKNGSKIMLTAQLGCRVYPCPLWFNGLNVRESWQILYSINFLDESCPLELEEIGMQIAYKFQGLPQAIVPVGGLLSKMKKRRDIWEQVANSLDSIVMDGTDMCKNILALLYYYLPQHLKACFLYMGNFPANYEIPVRKLIWLWIAKGFIRPSLEEIAEDYFYELTARSLIMMRRESSDGRIKTCYIHDSMRELCLREYRKQNLLHVIGSGGQLQPMNKCDEAMVTLTEIKQELVSISKELNKIHDERKVEDLEVTSSKGKSFTLSDLSPSRRTANTEGKLVGLETDLVTMLDHLTGHPSQLKVFSIIGMAGIGKTTFSKKLYDDALVIYHFHVRVWVTVSQQYQARELLLGVLHCVTNVSDEIYGKSDEELREQVYRSLKGKRYLIVLDDMWDTKAWDYLRRTFPDDNIGSRIMLTSRLRDVAVHANQDTPPHRLRCLNRCESWELLCSKIFLDESCPPKFVEIGKQIAYKCQGLPLAIVVVGGLLSKLERKLDVWEEIAKSLGSLVIGAAEHCQNVLALSYNHLSDHLKACFLYMGIFPEDYEISVKRLIWLWVAEGFIRPTLVKSMEEVAEDYLEDLTARSLILVKRKSSDGRMKTCYIHDLMRELCLGESKKLNFLHVINNCGQLKLKNPLDNCLLRFDNRQEPRRLSFHSSIQKYIRKTSLAYTRSVLCFEKISLSDREGCLGMDLKLLKVLDIMNIHLINIPKEILYLTHLKFLAFSIQNYFNMMHLSVFRNLQILIVDCEWDGLLSKILWDMLELRHFQLKRICIPYSQLVEFQSPSTSMSELLDAEVPFRVLSNLKSLSKIRPVSCSPKVFLSMPNLKKLGIHEFEEDYGYRGWFNNLVHLRELEKLKYVFCNPFASSVLRPDRLPSWDRFPPKLAKLTLSGTSLPWEDMLKLSMLPNLEVLKLRNYAFTGAVWKSEEGGFRCLKFLLIGSTDLEAWEADGDHFPKLQHLVLKHCRSLKGIPYGIGEAPLLESIELHCCNDSAVKSARDLQEEQQSQGYDLLTICITEG